MLIVTNHLCSFRFETFIPDLTYHSENFDRGYPKGKNSKGILYFPIGNLIKCRTFSGRSKRAICICCIGHTLIPFAYFDTFSCVGSSSQLVLTDKYCQYSIKPPKYSKISKNCRLEKERLTIGHRLAFLNTTKPQKSPRTVHPQNSIDFLWTQEEFLWTQVESL